MTNYTKTTAYFFNFREVHTTGFYSAHSLTLSAEVFFQTAGLDFSGDNLTFCLCGM